ncbi:helix-turn-helix transcriptional regulator [Halocella sp. SP3-1]|uniref:helix-turn-helix domain-containing protein n=1 Tax=Halocella sp. SP3-1 TaxID=2382161 RepID=UPI000F7595B8|nr:helix-turn-helix transcriptional regulator [Halocella sp. SP3-1]AZO96188.1 XRE family transcriptional regulator [Halocella sp. SP3-1]
MKSFAKRLRNLRKENNKTLEDVAKAINVTKSTLSMYENNKRKPQSDILNNLADYFNCSIDYLMCKTDKRHGLDKETLPPVIQELIKEFQIQDIEALSYAKEKGLSAKDIKAIVDTFEQLRPILTKKDK